MTDSEV